MTDNPGELSGNAASAQQLFEQANQAEKRKRGYSALPPADCETVLAGIQAIKWHTLGHTFGQGGNVPDLLRALLSDDPDERDQARSELAETIMPEGSLTPVTAAVVPFLLRMLTHPGTPDCHSILSYLANIAEEARAPQSNQAACDSHAALAESIPVLLEICEQKKDLRALTAYILAWFPEHGADCWPVLERLLAGESEPGVQSALLLSLADLMDHGLRSQAFFEGQMISAKSKIVRFVSAVALIDRARDQAPVNSVIVIMQTITEMNDNRQPVPSQEAISEQIEQKGLQAGISHLFQTEPLYWDADSDMLLGLFWEENGFTAALVALAKLGNQRGLQLLLLILPTLPESEPIVPLLLDMVFDAGQSLRQEAEHSLQADICSRFRYEPVATAPSLEALTVQQLEVLEALLVYDPLWQEEDNPLKLFRLPVHRDLLQHFLTGGKDLSGPTSVSNSFDAEVVSLSNEEHTARIEHIEQELKRAGFPPN